MSNPEICEQLVISEATAKTHRRPHPPKARPARPRPSRHLRLRDRARRARLSSLARLPDRAYASRKRPLELCRAAVRSRSRASGPHRLTATASLRRRCSGRDPRRADRCRP
jgi:hypothetical protein